MSGMLQVGFDYTALPVDSALTARAAAERIKLRLKRTVEDIIEIGRELTTVKDELPHGQFLPWIAAEFEMSERTARDFMRVHERFGGKSAIIADFKPTILYALSAPSTPESVIDLAIERVEAGDKVTVAEVKEWKAMEAELEEEKRRTQEFREESNERRKKIRELEQQLDLAERAEPKVVEKIPDDYETIKRQSTELRAQTDALQKQLDDLQKQQSKLVNDQVKTKLQGYQSELDKLEEDKRAIEDIVARKQAYLDSLSGEVKRIETHQSVINGARMELIGLAAFLNDIEPISDQDTIKKWLALADMHEEAMKAIRSVFGEHGLLLRSAP